MSAIVGIIFAIYLICFIPIPFIILLYLWRSKYCSCPYCGNNILKSARVCPQCSKVMPKYDTLENKTVKVGKVWQDSAKIMATPEGKRFERLDKK